MTSPEPSVRPPADPTAATAGRSSGSVASPRSGHPRFFPSRVSRGAQTERAALEYLHANGCRLVARNVRFRVGEIDLIVRDGEALVFVEVRGRGEGSLEAAEVALPFAKRLKLWRAIELYLLRIPAKERAAFRSIRIDFLATNGREWFWYKNIELR